MESELIVGPRTLQDGAKFTQRGDRTGATMVGDVHGRFTEAALRNTLFSAGMNLTSISNATFTTGTLRARQGRAVEESTTSMERLFWLREACWLYWAVQRQAR